MFDSLPDALFTLIVEFADYDGMLLAIQQGRKAQSALIKSKTPKFLNDACEHGHLHVIRCLNLTLQDIRYDDNYALYLAALNGHLNVIKFFVERGPPKQGLTIKDIRSCGNRALHVSARNGHLHMIQYFVERGPTKQGLVLKDIRSYNNLALRLAVFNGHLHVIQYFVERGLTAEDIYSENNNALYMAARNGHQHVVDYLCERFGIT